MSLGGFGRERDRTLQVRAGERQLSLLSKQEPEQIVRLRMPVVAADGLGEVIARRRQVTAGRRFRWRGCTDRRRGWPPARGACAPPRSAASGRTPSA